MFRLADLVQNINGAQLLGDENIRWNTISIDSRTIKPGELFLALKGENYNGHNFIKDACQKGASGVVLGKDYFQKHLPWLENLSLPLVVVEDTLQAYQSWARHYLTLFNPLAICVTGSNGKTTTKEMIAHLLSARHQVLKSEGNYNNEIGVPVTILNLTPEHEILVLEMAAQKAGEIKNLTSIARPDIAVLTNIGEAHIGLFGTKDIIAREKAELILALKDKGTAILNRDDNYFNFLLNCVPVQREVISFGFHPEAQVRAGDFWQKNERELNFELVLPGQKKYQVLLPLLGKFNISNALAALAVGLKAEIPLEDLVGHLATFKGIDFHMQCLSIAKGITLIQDYYNANPTATKEALFSVASVAAGRFKVAVLGDMLELGENSADYHREVGSVAATISYDMVIAYGKYANFIRKGALDEGMDSNSIFCFEKEEKERLADWLVESIPENSIVLLKGSRSMQMEDIVQCWQSHNKDKGSSSHA